MAATIGPDDLGIYDSPRPRLLRDITGLPPVEKGSHVVLEGVRSTQRLAAGDIGGSVWLALWPAELKDQAIYLYGRRLGRPMISAALSRGWIAAAAPQLAFRNSQPALRLYMAPEIDPLEYARRWEDFDLDWVGAHSRADVVRNLWPWLKSRGYVDDKDDFVLEEWLGNCLGRRDAFLRPGLRLIRRCTTQDSPSRLRDEVNTILTAADEPTLPG